MIRKSNSAQARVVLNDNKFDRGLIQVYTGPGKGKTTAAIGLAIRAVGQGLRVFIAQFMKGASYGELNTLAAIGNITVKQYGAEHWIFLGRITQEDKEAASNGLEDVIAAVYSEDFDIVVMDEVNVATTWGLVPTERVLDLIRTKPPTVELVLTGRSAPPEIIELADLVTEMVPVKHPFEKGIFARRGIEF